MELENLRQNGTMGRKKPLKISPTNKNPASPSNNIPMSPTDSKTKNTGPSCHSDQHCPHHNFCLLKVDFDIGLCVSTDSSLNVVADGGDLSFRAVSPALSNRRGSQCSQVSPEYFLFQRKGSNTPRLGVASDRHLFFCV